MGGWMDEAMKDLRPWIGRVRTVEDDIGMMAVRRVAATFDVDPDSIKRGDELPPHWFTVFFCETIRQSELGPDGHPNKGIVLPPIPMPRRMGAGRQVKIMAPLRAGDTAVEIGSSPGGSCLALLEPLVVPDDRPVTVKVTVLTPRSVQSKLVWLALSEATVQLSVLPPSICAALIDAVPPAFSWIVMS